MSLIRPRLTDHYGISVAQDATDFAIPFLDEDIPLYVDPFLLWKSPAMQETALHGAVVNCFNRLGHLALNGEAGEARKILIESSECDHIGLGFATKGGGRRMNPALADTLLNLFLRVPALGKAGFVHIEAAQLLVEGFASDRISDIFCSFAKSHLIDYTMQMARDVGLPTQDAVVTGVFDSKAFRFGSVKANVPVNPSNGKPVLLIPRRWLRKVPWIGLDDYVERYYKEEVQPKPGSPASRPRIVTFNRDNFGVVESYVRARELAQSSCRNDPLFKQIPVISAKQRLKRMLKLPTGKTNNADKKYEDEVVTLLSSILYPYLDMAADQVRVDSGAQIRDLIFFNTRSVPFLQDVHEHYESRQIVFEIKNVQAVEREHLNQLNRYLAHEFGRFGVLVTRKPLSSPMLKNAIDLWAGQRKCLLVITDQTLEQLVEVYDSGQRKTIDILQSQYLQFSRRFPV